MIQGLKKQLRESKQVAVRRKVPVKVMVLVEIRWLE
jgi:hypothetical protein